MSARIVIGQGCFSQMNNPKLAKRLTYDSGDKKPKENIEPNNSQLSRNQQSVTNLNNSSNFGKQSLCGRQPAKKDDAAQRSLSKNNNNNNNTTQNKSGQAQIAKLRLEVRKLKDKIKQQIKQADQCGEQLVKYEGYIQELQAQLSRERARFKTELQELRLKLVSFIQSQKQRARLEKECQDLMESQLTHNKKIQEYEYLLHESIMFVMASFNQVTHLRDGLEEVNKSTIGCLSKGFIKIFKLLNPLIKQWGIQQKLKSTRMSNFSLFSNTFQQTTTNTTPQQHHFNYEDSFDVLKQEQPSKQTDDVIDWSRKDFQNDLSQPDRGLSHRIEMNSLQNTFEAKNLTLSFENKSLGRSPEPVLDEDKYQQQEEYRVARDYMSNNQNHLVLKAGDMVKILKKNKNSLWIGEANDIIAYFPPSCLQ